ncbi:MAG: phosphonate C-P lyase system protein PhnG [Rhizobiales bacterium]|nr:phosphonate C-P lyase system protein PhnG [Hyphomicrobiales bacterium]
MRGDENPDESGQHQLQDTIDRQRWIGLLARASSARIAELVDQLDEIPSHERLRGPEAGLVMVRGRASGSGAPFNLGEMSLTRCSVRIASGRIGHGYVQGRDNSHAETAALLDAMLQEPELHDRVMAGVIEDLARVERDAHHETASKAAATRVNFFTMTRGED